jgi:hypothetical protein
MLDGRDYGCWDGWLDGLPAESVTIETIALWRRNGVKI